MSGMRVAVIDDWQNVAPASTDWSALKARAEVVYFQRSFPEGAQGDAGLLADFDIILPMRERSIFSAALLSRLPRLKMLSLTGMKAPNVDFAYCTGHGVLVSQAGSKTPAYAAEMALALMLAAARKIPQADANMRAGRFQDGIGLGQVMHGATLGIIGLGKIGTEVARYGQALGMRVLAWSQNLTAEKAKAAGATLADRDALLSQSDVVTLHLILSERTRGIVGEAELGRMKRGAILVNTARGPLVDEAALLKALHENRILAGLDVYDEEPLPSGHPLRSAPGTVLSPHLGFSTSEVFGDFYKGAIENILAFLDGAPTRIANPEVLKRLKS